MEINTKIIEIKQALGKDSNKLYWQVETSDGRMTCHESSVIENLKEFVDGMCNLAVRQTPKKDNPNEFWNNIIGIVKNNEGISYSKPKTQTITGRMDFTSDKNEKPIPVLASKTNVEVEEKPIEVDLHLPRPNTDVNCDVMCAKDIFIVLLNDPKRPESLNATNLVAIKLVKQARDSFS